MYMSRTNQVKKTGRQQLKQKQIPKTKTRLVGYSVVEQGKADQKELFARLEARGMLKLCKKVKSLLDDLPSDMKFGPESIDGFVRGCLGQAMEELNITELVSQETAPGGK